MDLNVGLWQGSLEGLVQLECRSGWGAESELREGSLFGVGRLTTEVVDFWRRRQEQLTCGGLLTGFLTSSQEVDANICIPKHSVSHNWK